MDEHSMKAMEFQSLGSSGSVTALAVIPSCQRSMHVHTRGGNQAFNSSCSCGIEADMSIESQTHEVKSTINNEEIVLFGICSNLYVHCGEEAVLCEAVLPAGLRIHGIQWVRIENPDDTEEYLVLIHGGRCARVLQLSFSEVTAEEGHTTPQSTFHSDGAVQLRARIRQNKDVHHVDAWIMSSRVVQFGPHVLLLVGTIDNAISTYVVSWCEGELQVGERCGKFWGQQRSLLYSMDLHVFSVGQKNKEVEQYSFCCRVAGGTVLLDVTVWDITFDLDIPQKTLVRTFEHSIGHSYILKGHKGSIHCVAWDSSGTILASGSDDRSIKVWRVPQHLEDVILRPVKELYAHTSRIWDLVFSPKNALLCSGSEDGQCFLWNLSSESDACMATFKGHRFRGVWHVVLHQEFLYTGGADGAVKIWNLWNFLPKKFMIRYLNEYKRYEDGLITSAPWNFGMFFSEQLCHAQASEQDGSLRLVANYCTLSGPEMTAAFEDTRTKIGRVVNKDSKSEWVRCMELSCGGTMLVLATNKGRFYVCHIEQGDFDAPKSLKLVYETSNGRPITSMRKWQSGTNRVRLAACDFNGTITLMEIQLDQSLTIVQELMVIEWKPNYTTDAILDCFFVDNQEHILTTTGSGHNAIWKIDDLQGKKIDHIVTLECPLGSRITSICAKMEYSGSFPAEVILVLGSSLGGVSVWHRRYVGFGEDLNMFSKIRLAGYLKNAHDKTPVQWTQACLDMAETEIWSIQSGAINGCIQRYALKAPEAGEYEFSVLDEKRYDALLVISGRVTDECHAEGLVYGFSGTNFVVCDEKLDGEILCIHCSSWRKSHAFYADRERGQYVFCKDVGNGCINIFKSCSNAVSDMGRSVEKTNPVPIILNAVGHGREINAVLSLPGGITITASEDASIRCGSWSDQGEVLWRFSSNLLSSNPGGSTTRSLAKLRLGANCESRWVVVSAGAKEVMSAWEYNAVKHKLRNVSTHASLGVRNRKKTNEPASGYGDLRILCVDVLESSVPGITCFVITASSDGNVELRFLPHRFQKPSRFQRWPLVCTLATSKTSEEAPAPILSLCTSTTADSIYVYGGTTLGDIMLWDLTSTIKSFVSSENTTVQQIRYIRRFPCMHQSGVNCISVQTVDNCYNVLVSGGDDQSIRIIFLEGLNLVSQFKENCAHSSAVKGIWTDAQFIFSVGLDQKLRAWRILNQLKTRDISSLEVIQEVSSMCLQVLEPAAIDVCQSRYDIASLKKYSLTVVGRGIENIDFKPNTVN